MTETYEVEEQSFHHLILFIYLFVYFFQNDYSKYGIAVMVKFRGANKLRMLTAQHQSGGERAVATALYMLSLQNQTSVPFRCVDEINQVKLLFIQI